MFKQLRRMLLIAALMVPWVTQAQVDTTTVANGTTTNSYIPFYGTWMDEDQHNQIIYPASMVGDLVGDSIVGMKFYMSSVSSTAWGATATIKLGTTGSTTLTGLDNSTALTTVWTGTVNGTTSTIYIEFDDAYPFIGGNLLVDITTSTNDEYGGCSFYGVAQTNASYYTYSSSGAAQSFIPKTDFFHVDGDFMNCLPASGLTALDVNPTSFTLSWNASEESSTYLVYFNGAYVTTLTYDTSYTFTGLDPMTVYNAGVRVLCSGSDTSMLLSIPVKTACSFISNLPYEVDFESSSTGSNTSYSIGVDCWELLTNATSYPYAYVSNNTSYNHTPGGSKGIYWYRTTSTGTYGTYTCLVMPGVDTEVYDMDALSIHFWAKASSASYHPKFYIGVMTDPTDITTFDTIEYIEVEGTAWALYGTTLTGYTGTGKYLAISSNKTSSLWIAYVDDISITEGWCEMPQNPDFVADTDQITLFWEPNGGTSFTVYLGTDTIENVTDTFYTFTGLTANTPYTYGIATECNNTMSLFQQGVARTACAPITVLPWTETFESAPTGGYMDFSFVPCWARLNDATTYFYAYISSSSSYNHTPGGNKGIYWYRTTSTGDYGTYNVFVLPPFDNETYPINTLEMKFWAKSSSTSYNPYLVVGAMSNPNDISTFDTIEVVEIGNSTMWQEYIVSFGNYDGDGTMMAIRSNKGNASWYAYVDDFTIEELPTCPPITDLSVDATTAGAAIVTWGYQPNIADPNGYNVEYGPVDGSESPSSETVSDPNILLLGLTPGTDYYIKVQADCDGDYGLWDSITFHTVNLGCGQVSEDGIDAAIGEGTSTYAYLPTYGYYGHTLSQQVFTKAEMGKSGKIEEISVMASSAPQQRDMEIYLTHCPNVSLTTFYHPDEDSLMVKVYDGTPSFTANEWYTFYLDTAFYYDTALGHLLVCFRDKTNSYTTPYNYYYTHTNPNGNSVYIYQDGSAYDPYSQTGGTTTSSRNNMIFRGGECLAPASCAKPSVAPLYVGSDTVIVSWIPGYDETEWNIDYRLVGDTVWTNVLEGTSDMQAEITGLSANSYYEIRVSHECEDSIYAGVVTVKTDCGLISALPFFEDFESNGTTSSSSPNFIPCWFRATDATSYYYPYVSNSTTYNHTPGGSYGLYWSASTTASYGNTNIIVLPGLNTDLVPINEVMLTFWAKKSSASYQPTLIIGALSDPEDLNTFVGYDTILPAAFTTEWQKYTTRFNEFDNDTCIYIGICQKMPSSAWYIYMDDIGLSLIPPCENVENIEVTASATSAIISWDGVGNYQGAVIEYKDTINNTWYSTSVSGQEYVVLNNLYPSMPYSVHITAICGEDTISGTVSASFNTKGFGCALVNESASFVDTIGNGTTTSSYFPTYGTYNYSLTQQIFTATEIGSGGVITSLSVMPSSFQTSNIRTIELYLAHTSAVSLSSFIHPSDMVKVYEGSPVMTNGQWYTMDFDQGFNYNGSDNLLVCFRDMTGSWTTSSTFYGHTNPNGNSVYIYQDGSAYDAFTTTGGTTSTFRNNIILSALACDSMGICAAPAVIVTDVTSTTVDVIWAHGNQETSWNVYYRLDGDNTWTTAATGVTDSSYQFTGLQSGMPYNFRVESVCDQPYSSDVNATTDCAFISQLPFTEDFNNWGSGSGTLPNCWYRSGSYSTYSYISTSYNHSGMGGGSVYMYGASGTSFSTLIMPALDTTIYPVNETELIFSAYCSSTSYTSQAFIVGVVEDPDDFSTFEAVDTVTATIPVSSWHTFVVPLTNYTGTGAHVAVRTMYPGTTFYTYIDDFLLEVTPSCPRVEDLTASNPTASSIDLGWTDTCGATTTWQIEYGPFGFQQGNGTLVTANSNPFTLSNPTCNSGMFYVRPICSNGDTGYWNFEPGTFYLGQTPATVPYNYDFEDVTEWNNWQGSTNNLTTAWTRGTAVADSGSYSMYVSADAGATYKPYSNSATINTAIFRDIDFGTVDTSFRISFRSRAGGTISNTYDALMVFLVDPNVTPIASNSNITSPWGNVNDLYTIEAVRLDTTWQTYEANFDNISGVHRVAFFWFNQNTGASYPALLEPAAVDNIHIDYESCPRPSNFTTTNTSAHSATVNWQGPASANYQIIWRIDGGTNQYSVSSTNHITFSNLDSMATYHVWVRKVCGAGDTSLWSDRFDFTTPLCDNGAVALNYDASMSESTSSYSPIGYSFYNYSYTQTIIDSAFMASLGDAEIKYFGFSPANTTASTYFTNMDVYFANVSETNLSSGWIMPDTTDHVFEQVFSQADFCYNETGWQIHEMDTSFIWDGHSNVLVAVVRGHGSYSSGASFNAHSIGTDKMRYAYTDSGPFSISDPTSYTSSSYTSNIAGDIMLISCNAGPSCAMPTGVYANNITYNSATLNWTGSASAYEVRYKAGTDLDWTTLPQLNTTSLLLSSLSDSTVYFFQVRSVCTNEESDEPMYSNWAEGTFTTLYMPCFAPSNLTEMSHTYSTATVDWTENGVASQWNVHVWNTQFDSVYTSTSHTFVISGLTQNTDYLVAVSAKCNAETESETSDTIQIHTNLCQVPSGLMVTSVTSTTASIVWGGSGIGFDIEYGDEHFSEGVNTTVVHVNGTSYTITGLQPEYDYSVSVRAECEAGVFSAYCAQADFTTLAPGEGIENAGEANVTIYPNPTTEATTIAISGVTGEVEITLVDLSGRVVMTDSMTCAGDCAKRLQVSGLSQGAYFVRLSGENVNMVKKLIVK